MIITNWDFTFQKLSVVKISYYFSKAKMYPMQSTMYFADQLQQINHSFIEASFYDPTTYYLNDAPFDRDEFKRLRKEGLIELSFQNHIGKRYTLSNKGKQLLGLAA